MTAELDQLLGLIVTSVLLISSFFMNRAEVSMAQGDQRNFTSISITMVLGIDFPGRRGWGGVADAPFGPATGPEGAVFYMMTGMHAFHVFTGVIFLALSYGMA